MKANLTPEVLGMKPLPTCDASFERDHDYDAMVRKWEYLFAYASTGFARGYISWYVFAPLLSLVPISLICHHSHMWSWIRANDCPEPCA
jgi:hypothetical protein